MVLALVGDSTKTKVPIADVFFLAAVFLVVVFFAVVFFTVVFLVAVFVSVDFISLTKRPPSQSARIGEGHPIAPIPLAPVVTI